MRKDPLMKIDVAIRGVTPLLMCAFKPEMLEKATKKDGILPRDEAESFTYRNKKGNLIIPSNCLFASILEAGKYYKVGKKQLTTTKNSVIAAAVRIIEPECDLGTKDFEVDSRGVVIPATGGRILRHRPRLDEWETSFTMILNTDVEISNHTFTFELVNKLVVDAGRICGVLAYRPSCKGTFGTFMVTKFKEIKDKEFQRNKREKMMLA